MTRGFEGETVVAALRRRFAEAGKFPADPMHAYMHPDDYAQYMADVAALDAADRKRKERALARRTKRALQSARKVQRQARRRGRR